METADAYRPHRRPRPKRSPVSGARGARWALYRVAHRRSRRPWYGDARIDGRALRLGDRGDGGQQPRRRLARAPARRAAPQAAAALGALRSLEVQLGADRAVDARGSLEARERLK